MSIYEVEIGGEVYELEANSPEDAASKAQKIAPQLTENSTPAREPKDDSTFLQRLGVGGTPEQRTLFGMPKNVESAIFPRAAESKEKALSDNKITMKERLMHGASGAADLLSAPGRAVASLPALVPGGESFSEAFSRTKGKERTGAGNIPELAGDVLRDPSLIPAAIATGGVSLAGKPLLSKMATGAAAGAREGAASAGTHQLERFGEEGNVSPKDAALEIGLSTAAGGLLPAGGEGVKRSVTGTAKFANSLTGKLAQELSGVSEEALRMAKPFSKGQEALKKAAGTQKVVGEKILDALDDYDKFIPERGKIGNALKNMEPINSKKITTALSESMTNSDLSALKNVDDNIAQVIQDIEKASVDGRLNAQKAFKIRKDIDNLIGDAFGKESGAYINALKNARYAIKDELVESAKFSGKPEYIDAMNILAKKMELADNLKGYIGKSKQVQERKIEQFVGTLFGKNKTDRQRVVKELGDMFGEDFIQESKLAHLAAQLGESGTPSLLPTQSTGRSTMGIIASLGTKGATLPLSSPFIASKVTLPISEGMENISKKGSEALLSNPVQFAGRQAVRSGSKKEEEKRPNLSTLSKMKRRAYE